MRIAVLLKTYPNIINPCSFLCVFSILVTVMDWTTPSNLSLGLLFYGVDRIIENLFTMFRYPRDDVKYHRGQKQKERHQGFLSLTMSKTLLLL
jgi:hypothetical protein